MGYNKDMFLKAFKKVATMYTSISPEQFYELKTEKYPHEGANIGAVGGALAGALKGAKGKKSKGALTGAAAGGLAGAGAGILAGRAVKSIELKRLTRAAKEMNLRSTPSRRRRHEE